MSFARPTHGSADVEMTLEDEELPPLDMGIDVNTRSHTNAHFAVPGVSSSKVPSNFHSVEEYAALMGITLDTNNVHAPTNNHSSFYAQTQPSSAELAKIQANAHYLENLCRPRDAPSNVNSTSMTLPAGIGSGLNNVSNPMFGSANQHASYPNDAEFNNPNHVYSSPLASNGNMYPMHPTADKVSAVNLLPNTAVMNGLLHPTPSYPPVPQPQPRWLHQHELGSQTLSPEVLNAMLKNNAHAQQRYAVMKEEEKAALLKEEKSRERNRDHSRKSRLRKKEYVENLKQEVQQLHIYQEMCEQCFDLIALISVEVPGYIYAFRSSAYVRLLGYDTEHIAVGRSSFLEHVHGEDRMQVKRHFEALSGPGEVTMFTFRLKLANGTYQRAETTARVSGRGIVCCTRLGQDIRKFEMNGN